MNNEETSRALLELDQEFMRNAGRGDAAALVKAFYAPEAVIMPPNRPPVTGHPAITQFWSAVLSMGLKNATLDTTQIESDGNLAYGIGRYEMTLEPSGHAAVNDSGKYIVVYRRQTDGSWKAIADIWSSNLEST